VATRLLGCLVNQLNQAIRLRGFKDRLRGERVVERSDPYRPAIDLDIEGDAGILALTFNRTCPPRHRAHHRPKLISDEGQVRPSCIHTKIHEEEWRLAEGQGQECFGSSGSAIEERVLTPPLNRWVR